MDELHKLERGKEYNTEQVFNRLKEIGALKEDAEIWYFIGLAKFEGFEFKDNYKFIYKPK